MRQRGPRGGPVRLRQLRRSADHAGCGGHVRSCSSAWTLSALTRLLFRSSGTRHHDAHLLFLDARGLAGELAQIVKLRATHASTANNDNVRDHRTVHREDAFDADTVRDLSYGEAFTDTTPASRDAHALERLNPLLVAFL